MNTATMIYISIFSNPAPIPLKTTLSIIIDHRDQPGDRD